MEQQINPYEAGQALQQGYADPTSSVPVTPSALGALIGTKFWVSLVGISLLIVVGIQLLMIMLVGSKMGSLGSGSFIVVALQLAMLLVYSVLGIRLIQYGKAIGRLSGSPNNADLERAMDVQSKFWKLLGILCIVMFAIMIISWIAVAMLINSSTRF